MKNSKVLPLGPIDLKSRPHNHRALAWSSDAELAVAADDCVTIYLPSFPFLDPAQPFALDDDAVASAPPAEDANGLGILPAHLSVNDEGDDDLGSGDEEEEEDEEEDYNSEDDNGDEEMFDDDGDEDDDDNYYKDADGTRKRQRLGKAQQKQQRRQFDDETARVLWVSYPALHPELNLHVWEAAGKAMPLIPSRTGAAVDEDQQEQEVDVDVDVKVKRAAEQSPAQDEDHSQPGAGTGVIGGAGSSLNHVVAVEWSPSGLGRNRRPVLAVLTGCGRLAVYGEGGTLPFGSNAKPSRRGGDRGRAAVRDLQSWLVLWAVGEDFVVPGQEEVGYGEFVKAFAWCRELGTGRALLGYVNDLREIVILSVSTTFQPTEDGLEQAIWNVQEVARMETTGPHGQPDPCDPDYIPFGSSYSLRWSPWAKEGDSWSCLLSYLDRNYVGFKKITTNSLTWSPRDAPVLVCQSEDWAGQCMHLGTDAFLEFEDTIWSINNSLNCRGIVATPMLAEPFEVNMSAPPPGPKPTHSTAKCKTTFPPQPINNPITGLVIHPIALETTAPPLTPLYTAVRLSATATNPQWTETNHPASPSQWLTAIQAQITRHVPLGQAGREGDTTAEANEDGQDGIVRGPDDDDDDNKDNNNNKQDDDNDNDSDNNKDEADLDPDADFDPWINEGPDVHPHRMRLWGLARSPGGGTTAVLATPLLTQRPMRNAWGAHRSRVLFGWRARVGEPQAAAAEEEEEKEEAAAFTTATVVVDNHKDNGGGSSSSSSSSRGLTTEARLWEWMYGCGPGVLGLTPPLESATSETATTRRAKAPRQQQAQDEAAMARRARIRDLCRPFVAAQMCEICGPGSSGTSSSSSSTFPSAAATAKGHRVLDTACTQGGHRVAVCGVTGLAIMAPGISRACAVCQSRCLGGAAGYDVLERMLGPAAGGREEVVEAVKQELSRDVCARCGGKYLD